MMQKMKSGFWVKTHWTRYWEKEGQQFIFDYEQKGRVGGLTILSLPLKRHGDKRDANSTEN